MECRLLHGYDLDFSPQQMVVEIRTGFKFTPLPPPPPRNPLPLPRTPPPHPQESPDLRPSCQVALRTTWAASWRGALRTRRTSPSTSTPATRRGSPRRRPRTTSYGRRTSSCPSSSRTWRTCGWWGVLLGEGLRVKTLLHRLVPQLQLLPLSELLEL